jgi:hypothetical protein
MVRCLRLRCVGAHIDTSQSERLRNSTVKLVLAIFYSVFEVFENFEIILAWRQDLGWKKLLRLLLVVNIAMDWHVIVSKRKISRNLIAWGLNVV